MPFYEISTEKQAVAPSRHGDGSMLGGQVLRAMTVCDADLIHTSHISDEEDLRFRLGVAVYGLELGQHSGGKAFRWGGQSVLLRRGVRMRLVNVGASAAIGGTGQFGYPGLHGMRAERLPALFGAPARGVPLGPCGAVRTRAGNPRLLRGRDRRRAFASRVRRRDDRLQRRGGDALRCRARARHAHGRSADSRDRPRGARRRGCGPVGSDARRVRSSRSALRTIRRDRAGGPRGRRELSARCAARPASTAFRPSETPTTTDFWSVPLRRSASRSGDGPCRSITTSHRCNRPPRRAGTQCRPMMPK